MGMRESYKARRRPYPQNQMRFGNWIGHFSHDRRLRFRIVTVMDAPPTGWPDGGPELSRRRLLQLAGTAGLAVATVSACSTEPTASPSSSATPSPDCTGEPRLQFDGEPATGARDYSRTGGHPRFASGVVPGRLGR